MQTSRKLVLATTSIVSAAALGFAALLLATAGASSPTAAPVVSTPAAAMIETTPVTSLTFVLDLESADYMVEQPLVDGWVATRFSCAGGQEGCGQIQLSAVKDGQTQFWLARATDDKNFTVTDRIDLGTLASGVYATPGWTQQEGVEQPDGTYVCEGWFLSVFDEDGISAAWEVQGEEFTPISTTGLQVVDSCN